MSTHTFSTSAKPKGAAAAAAVALDNETSRKRFRRATSRRELVHSHPRVPTTFEWTGPGHEVFLLGSFSNWVEKHPMTLYEVLSDHIEHLLTIYSQLQIHGRWRVALCDRSANIARSRWEYQQCHCCANACSANQSYGYNKCSCDYLILTQTQTQTQTQMQTQTSQHNYRCVLQLQYCTSSIDVVTNLIRSIVA
jgi:hypothetical protein